MTNGQDRDGRADANADIHWPAGLTPDRADHFRHDEMLVHAPPEKVFRRLVDAQHWPRWYPAVQRVRLTGDLRPNSLFQVEIFGRRLDACVGEIVAPERFGWAATGLDLEVYHAWLLVPVPQGTAVTSEIAARGWSATTGGRRSAVEHDGNRQWLRNLKTSSEAAEVQRVSGTG